MANQHNDAGRGHVRDIPNPPKEDLRPPHERQNNLFRNCPPKPADPRSIVK